MTYDIRVGFGRVAPELPETGQRETETARPGPTPKPGGSSPLKALGKAKKGVSKWFQGRPHAVTVGLPGNTTTLERPPRERLEHKADLAPKLEPPKTFDVAQAEQTALRAQQILQRLKEPSVGVAERPGGPTGVWERMTRTLPWMRPKPVKQMQTLKPDPLNREDAAALAPQGLAGKDALITDLKARAERYEATRSEQAVYQAQRESAGGLVLAKRMGIAATQQRVQTNETRLAQTREQIDQARQALATMPSFSLERASGTRALGELVVRADRLTALLETDRQRLSQAREELVELEAVEVHVEQALASAHERLTKAVQHLHSSVAAAELVDIGGAVLGAEIAARHLDFVHGELERMAETVKTALTPVVGDPQQQVSGELTGLPDAIRAHAERRNLLMEGYQTACANVAAQEHNVAAIDAESVQARLRAVQARRVIDSPASTPEQVQAARGDLAMMETLVADLLVAGSEARDRLARASADLLAMEEEAATLESELDTMMRRRHELTQLAVAGQSAQQALAEPLALSAQQLRDQRGQLKKTIEAAAEVQGASIEALLTHPPGFPVGKGTDRLAQDLQQALRDWPVRDRLAGPLATAETASGAESPRSGSTRMTHVPSTTWMRSGTADVLPKAAAAECLSLALAKVCDGNAERATALLEQLRDTPTLAFVKRPGAEAAASTSAGPSADMVALFRLLAPLPRGVEMLQLLGPSEDGKVWDGKQLGALRAYWRADQAIEQSNDVRVRRWLGDAQRVAAERLLWPDEQARQAAARAAAGQPPLPDVTLDEHLDAKFNERERGAYNAVRNGFLSNAPGSEYDQHDKRLRKMTEEWMDRRLDRFAGAVLPALAPNRVKTPFGPDVLRDGAEMADRFGLKTHARAVGEVVQEAASRMGSMAQLLVQGSPDEETRRLNLAASVLGQYMAERGSRLKSMTPEDFKAVRKRHEQALAPSAGGAAPRAALPGVIGELALDAHAAARTSGRIPGLARRGVGVSCEDVLRSVAEDLARCNTARLSAEQKTDLAAGLGLDKMRQDGLMKLSHLTEYGRPQRVHLESKEELLAFFKPMLLEWGLRDRLKLSAGGTIGAGLPFLPYAAPPVNQEQVGLASKARSDALERADGGAQSGGLPQLVNPLLVTPLVNLGYGRKEEAFLQFFQPILGIEMAVGEARTHVYDGQLGLVAGSPVDQVGLSGSATAGASVSHMKQQGTIVRFLRGRGQDEAQRQNIYKAFESAVMWDKLEPAGGGRFAGPMEALLSRCPDAVVTRFDATADSTTLSLNAGFTAGLSSEPDKRRAQAALQGSATARAAFEQAMERRTEQAAAVSVQSDKSSTAKQTITLGLTARANVPQSARSEPLHERDQDGVTRTHGTFGGGALPMLAGVTREMAQQFERHGISPFRINDKQDGDLDRHYFTPKEMLAEIAANREYWLERCLETMPEVNGTKDTPENRVQCELLLKKFEQDIRELGETSRMCQYNVNYSMRPQASAWIDGLRMSAELHAALGNEKGKAEALQAIDGVLQQDSTWRPLMLIVRERGKQSHAKGLDFGAKLLLNSAAEGQRTAAQFPPP